VHTTLSHTRQPFHQKPFCRKEAATQNQSGKWEHIFCIVVTLQNCRAWNRRLEVALFFIQKDVNAPENNFYFSVTLQRSESTDIVGILIKCLHLFTPLFKSKVETIRNKFMELPTQDFSWVPFVHSVQKEHWENLHSCVSQWYRPNPSCCKQIDRHEVCHSSNTDTSDTSLEPVIQMHLQCQVSPDEGEINLQDRQYLIAGLLFMPHGSSEDLPPADKSSAIVVNHIYEQHCVHTDITLAQLEEITLAKAVEYFHQNCYGPAGSSAGGPPGGGAGPGGGAAPGTSGAQAADRLPPSDSYSSLGLSYL
jgi:hypothetical protein